MATAPVLFDSREAAAILKVSVRTVQRWVAEERMRPTRRSRGAVLFSGDEINRVAGLRRQRPGPHPAPAQSAELPLDAS